MFRQLDLAPRRRRKMRGVSARMGSAADDFLGEADAALEGIIGVLFDGPSI